VTNAAELPWLVNRAGLALSLGVGLLTAGVTTVIGLFVAPRGFWLGFVDMAHDGYVLKTASDLCGGAVLFLDTFTQYGVLGDPLNCLVLQWHDTLLSVKYVYALIYSIGLGLIAFFTTRWAGAGWGIGAATVLLMSAPFYRHGVMLSVHVLMIPAQVLTVMSLLAYARRPHPAWVGLAGALTGVVFLLKWNVGAYQIVGVVLTIVLITVFGFPRQSEGPTLVTLWGVGGLALVGTLAAGMLPVVASGSARDWFYQTILFTQTLYNPGAGGTPIASAFSVALSLANEQRWWWLLRCTLLLVTVIGISDRRTRSPALILLALGLTATLGNYPSANFMHQWWTLVPLVPLIPLAFPPPLRQPPFHTLARPLFAVRVDMKTVAAYTAAAVGGVAVMGTVLGTGLRTWDTDNGNWDRIRTFDWSCQPMAGGSRLDGMCISPDFAAALGDVDSRLRYWRSTVSSPQKLRNVTSVEQSMGPWSLLPIANLQDNISVSPALWQDTPFRRLYPAAIAEATRRGDILVDFGILNAPERWFPRYQRVDYVVAPSNQFRQKVETTTYGWSIYAPVSVPR